MTDQELICDTWIRSCWLRPDSETIDTPSWFQVRTPSITRGNANCVRRAILAPDEVEARISEVLADHTARGAKIHWSVSPVCAPADLSARLQDRGFVLLDASEGMVRDTSPLAMPPGTSVERIGRDGIGTYVAVSLLGWGLPPEAAEEIRADMERRFDDPTMAYFVARVDGEPAGAAALVRMPGRGYLIGASVRPSARHQGAYRALLSGRLAQLASEGFDRAVIIAMAATSAPTCRALGFHTACTLHHLEFDPAEQPR